MIITILWKLKAHLNLLRKETSILNLLEEEGEFTSSIKPIQNLKQDKSSFMDNENHKNTWNNFTKFVIWGTAAVILVLALMAIFLL